MNKAKLTSHEEMEADKIRDDMAMTPEQRLLVALQLMQMAFEISPDKTLRSKEDGIEWIELKSKNDKSRKRTS